MSDLAIDVREEETLSEIAERLVLELARSVPESAWRGMGAVCKNSPVGCECCCKSKGCKP